jgi:hypothetical protein
MPSSMLVTRPLFRPSAKSSLKATGLQRQAGRGDGGHAVMGIASQRFEFFGDSAQGFFP